MTELSSCSCPDCELTILMQQTWQNKCRQSLSSADAAAHLSRVVLVVCSLNAGAMCAVVPRSRWTGRWSVVVYHT